MQTICWTIGAVLLLPGWQPVQQRVANAAKLEEVLARWEKAMGSLNSVSAKCSRISINNSFKLVEKYSGEVKLLKSKGPREIWQCSLFLEKEGHPKMFDKIIWTGSQVYIFDSLNKTIVCSDRTDGKAETPVHNGPIGSLLSPRMFSLEYWLGTFVFGIDSKEAKARYEITLVPDPRGWYHYLKLVPRTDQDRIWVKEVRLALNANTFLPRKMWFLRPNGDEVSWDFPQANPNAELGPKDFAAPIPPAGWQMKKSGD